MLNKLSRNKCSLKSNKRGLSKTRKEFLNDASSLQREIPLREPELKSSYWKKDFSYMNAQKFYQGMLQKSFLREIFIIESDKCFEEHKDKKKISYCVNKMNENLRN